MKWVQRVAEDMLFFDTGKSCHVSSRASQCLMLLQDWSKGLAEANMVKPLPDNCMSMGCSCSVSTSGTIMVRVYMVSS